MAVSPLATESYPANTGNYSGPEARTNITDITVHHMAGVLSAAQCGAIFQRPGRRGSSHYGIGVNGEIAWYVDENCVAWTNSNWASNQGSVTIECADDENGGNWHVSDATLNSVIKLVADIAKRNGLGHLVVGKNLTMHKQFANTNCPGPYLESKFQYIADEANKINEGAPAPEPTPTPTPPAEALKTNEQIADEVIAGKWGNGQERKDRLAAAGYDWGAVQAIVDQRLKGSNDSAIKVGDKVRLKEYRDYNGTRLWKTRDFYYVSQINGDRVVLRADSMNGPVYCAAKMNNLERA